MRDTDRKSLIGVEPTRPQTVGTLAEGVGKPEVVVVEGDVWGADESRLILPSNGVYSDVTE